MAKEPLGVVIAQLRKDLTAARRKKRQGQSIYLDLPAITRAVRRYELNLHRYAKESAARAAVVPELADFVLQILVACTARRLCTLRQPLPWLRQSRRNQLDFYAVLFRKVARLPVSVRRLVEQVAGQPISYYGKHYRTWRRASRFLASYPASRAQLERQELRRIARIARY